MLDLEFLGMMAAPGRHVQEAQRLLAFSTRR